MNIYDQTVKKSKEMIITIFRVSESLMLGGTTVGVRETHTGSFNSIGYAPSHTLISRIQNTGLEGVEEGEAMRMETI